MDLRSGAPAAWPSGFQPSALERALNWFQSSDRRCPRTAASHCGCEPSARERFASAPSASQLPCKDRSLFSCCHTRLSRSYEQHIPHNHSARHAEAQGKREPNKLAPDGLLELALHVLQVLLGQAQPALRRLNFLMECKILFQFQAHYHHEPVHMGGNRLATRLRLLHI